MNLASLLDCLASSLAWVARASWQASVVAALVLIVQAMLRGRVSARWRYGLWLLVVVRLILPTLPATRFSPFNWLRIEAPSEAVAKATVPRPIRLATAIRRHDPIASPRTAQPVVDRPTHGEAEEVDMAISPGNQGDALTATSDAPASYLRASDAPAANVPLREVFAHVPVVLPAPVHHAAPATGVEPSSITPRAKVPPVAKAASTPVISRLPAVSLRQAVAGIWACGALILLMHVLWATGRLARIIRRLPEVRDSDLAELVHECASRLGLRQCPRVLEAPEGTGPALAGVLRPRLLLPAAALRGLGRNELRLVVLHELVHLRRGDLALNWLLAMLQAFHWFNPAVWFAFARLRADRELACDERVLSSSPPGRRGNDCRDYGRAILKLLEPSHPGSVPGLAVGVLDGGGWARKAQLRRRITMIARFDRPAGRWPAMGVALSLLVGGVAFTGAVRGEDDPAAKPATVGGAGVADDSAGPSGQPSTGGFPGGASGGGASPGAGPAGGSPGSASAPGTPGGIAGTGGPHLAGGGKGSGAMVPAGSNGRPGMSGLPPQPAAGGRPGMGGPMMPAMSGYPHMGAGGIGHGAAESIFGRVEDPEAAKADAKAAGLLHKTIALSMQGVPLDEFLHYVADQTGADIFLDSKALAELQIVPDAPVTLQVREPRSAQSLLELGLRSAGGDLLGYEVSNGLVIVTTRAVLEKTRVTRSYDVGKLIDTDPGVDLRVLIQDTVAPGTWRSRGDNLGIGGAIGLFNRKLIVTATEPNHREIARLLALLAEQPAKAAGPNSRKAQLEGALHDLSHQLSDCELMRMELTTILGSNHPRLQEITQRCEVLRKQYAALQSELDDLQSRQPGATSGPDAHAPGTPRSSKLPLGERPSSSIKADKVEIQLNHPNPSLTLTGDVEIRTKPGTNPGGAGQANVPSGTDPAAVLQEESKGARP
ncbi:MAG TPA: M56 family metallopeptidase [Tepidisphaeraceae bacterium]|jgi:beta-lactamase regulating signal transducer with metallopeptidase domain|nr:M56 family metallopeptidase [Tepidisphaeraceae bacterium]